jgi:hypothetical protein
MPDPCPPASCQKTLDTDAYYREYGPARQSGSVAADATSRAGDRRKMNEAIKRRVPKPNPNDPVTNLIGGVAEGVGNKLYQFADVTYRSVRYSCSYDAKGALTNDPRCPTYGEQLESADTAVTFSGGAGALRAVGNYGLRRVGQAFFERQIAKKVPTTAKTLPSIAGAAPVSGLRSASAGLRQLFTDGSLAGRSIIGVRDTLMRNGFSRQTLTRNKSGYLFRGPSGEEVRIMRRGGGWDIRVQNRYGNQLDQFGNVGTPQTSHGIPLTSR